MTNSQYNRRQHPVEALTLEQPRRRASRVVHIGPVAIGGDNPVVVQSMTNTDTRDTQATLAQIERLAALGCEVARLAVPDAEAARALRPIRDQSPLPLVADIHFDSRLAVQSLESGADALRINPGNIGGGMDIDRVVDAARAAGASIRIGVNSGSVERPFLLHFGGPTPQAMVASALDHIRLLENRGFDRIKISLKSSSVPDTITAYRLLADLCDYPFHIGVTEAGTPGRGSVKSAVGLGALLWLGLGDTMRVSLSSPPEDELPVAWEILRSLGLRRRGPEIVSCPTCGRTEIDLLSLVNAVEHRLARETAPLTVAVMGCVVNGPGEAREADIGIAGGRDKGIIFRKGEVIRTVRGNDALIPAFLEELDSLLHSPATPETIA